METTESGHFVILPLSIYTSLLACFVLLLHFAEGLISKKKTSTLPAIRGRRGLSGDFGNEGNEDGKFLVQKREWCCSEVTF